MTDARKLADKIIADYKEHYSFPNVPQGESHMHDCIMDALSGTQYVNGWIPVTERLPKNGVPVIAFVSKDGENWTRRIRAFHCERHTISADEETINNEGADYVEAEDEFYLKLGWYEQNEYDEYFCLVCDPVTHWMPLPDGPPISHGSTK